jgi:hypothetical protein
MKVKIVLAIAILASLCVITIPMVKTQSKATPLELSSNDALVLLRTLATVEAEMKSADHSFSGLDRLLEHRAMPRKKAAEISKSDSSLATVRDYQLSVVVSPDGQHFQMSLLPKSGCGYSLFTNENWVIYEAKAMGCSN